MNDAGRIHALYRPVSERTGDFREVERPLDAADLVQQAARCLDCGVPFCHGEGCPLANEIPSFNAAAARGDWKTAWGILSRTSFFPEFTSRVCPALCEGSCTHGANDEAVMVRQIEKRIVETAFAEGWVAQPAPRRRLSRRVAVVGSGPAGLVAAEALRRGGADVTVFERDRAPGGLLRYGIPSFKLEKRVIDRRLALLEKAGIVFACSTDIGRDLSPAYLARKFDAVVLAVGTAKARDLAVPGREKAGVHLALAFLGSEARFDTGEAEKRVIDAKGKDVLVIGGGDTGSDCVGTANRQGAKSVTQIEIMPRPPERRAADNPWPEWPRILRTSSSHEEGCARAWNLNTLRMLGNDAVEGVEVEEVRWETGADGRRSFSPVEGTKRTIPAQLVLLALGFTGVPEGGATEGLPLARTPRGGLLSNREAKVFAAGDCATGASLVVRAMAHAKAVAGDVLAALG